MQDKYKLQTQDIQSMDLNNTTLDKLRQLLPEVFSESSTGKPHIDIEKLKLALGDDVDIEADNQTRYSFVWSGKKQAQLEANKPTKATLRPCTTESKNWDSTENVYIEGDNLEVLKLLQKSYYGKIKMIYIDPPYNTGKDFVYKDNYHDNLANYLQLTGQVDDDGNRMSTNSDSNGRYHTDWLNMMYPRLKLARNLLRDDGVIFISIDDNEVHNLRKICDEIFGEDNFVEQLVWKKKYGGGAKEKYIVSMHEYQLMYAKNIQELPEVMVAFDLDKAMKFYKYKDENFEKLGYYRTHPLEAVKSFDVRENLRYSVLAPDGTEVYPKRQWRWSNERFKLGVKNGEVIFSKNNNGEYALYSKQYLNDTTGEQRKTKFQSIIENIYTQNGTKEIVDIFGDAKLFDFPKPTQLINKLLEVAAIMDNDIILDFFSGSATTAHAVMQLNAEDGGNRKYICVQLPESTQPDSEAYKAGYKTICEIGKERIRRAGDKILTEWQAKLQQLNAVLPNDSNENTTVMPDIGFKVFKLDTSNIKPFDYDDLLSHEQDLLLKNRTNFDLFYEIILKQGYTLDYKQAILDIGGTSCYGLLNNENSPIALLVLDDAIKPNFATSILKYPLSLVAVKDSCFTSDEIKLNTLATLEQLQTSGNKLPYGNDLQIRII